MNADGEYPVTSGCRKLTLKLFVSRKLLVTPDGPLWLGHGEKLPLILKYAHTDFWRRTDDFLISMHACVRMKTVNAKGMNQGVVKYRYFSTPWPE